MIEIYPSKNTVKDLMSASDKKYFIPLWCELLADFDTPVSAYHKVCKDSKYSYLLESAEGGENFGRYSFIGTDPIFLLKSTQEESSIFDASNNKILLKFDNPYDLLEKFLADYNSVNFNLPYSPGLVGYLGYETIKYIESGMKKFIEKAEECASFPEAFFMFPGTVLVFDHVKHKIYVIINVLVDNNTDISQVYNNAEDKISLILAQISSSHNLMPLNLTPKAVEGDISSNITKEEWVDIVNKSKEHIKAGDIFQVVLSQRFCVETENPETFTIYRALRSINPSPYLYYLNFNDFQIIGSSPEMLVKCTQDKIASTRPIAGTRKRGATPERDIELQEELLNDNKERAEHIMLVDLGRNDLGKVCEYGSIKVKRLMDIEKFSHVQHIVSDVTGKLKEDKNAIDLIKACFPAGTLTGAPKIRAMEIIYDLEKSARGPYGGCLGYIGFNNEINTAITIRTMLVKGTKVFVQAGAGIVADSDPELEYKETQNKAAALIQTLAQLKYE